MARTWLSVILSVTVSVAVLFGCAGEPGEREYRTGVREIERGKNVRALALLEKSINKRPASAENALAFNYIGIAAWRLGRIPRAIEAFENSSRLDSQLVAPVYNLAALYYEAGDFPQAAELFEQVAEMDSADSRALEFMGSIYLQTGRPRDARRVLFEGLARDPQSPRLLTALALVESAIGDPDKAEFFMMQALEKDPDYAPALYDLGILYLRVRGDKEHAQAYLTRYLETAGDDARAAAASAALKEIRGAQEEPAAVTEVAVVSPSAETAAPAMPTAEERAAAPRKSAGELLDKARVRAHEGDVQSSMALCMEAAELSAGLGDTDGQEKALRTSVDLCLDQARAHEALAQFLLEQERYAEAAKYFTQAVMLDRTLASAHMGLAQAALQTGEYDAALVSLKQSIQLDENNPEPLWMLAETYDEKIGLDSKAIENYRLFQKRFPGDPRVVRAIERLKVLQPGAAPVPSPARAVEVGVNDRATVEPEPVSPPQAQETITLPRAVIRAPGGPRRLNIRRPQVRNTQAAVQAYNRGTLYQQQDDWERAVYFYTRALENDDTFVTAYFNLGSVYWAKGDYELAKDAYRRAIDLQPEGTSARYNLALLHRELREMDAAVAQLEAILDAEPDYAQAHYVLGLLYSEQEGQVEKAKAHYRRFLELAPDDPVAPIVREWVQVH